MWRRFRWQLRALAVLAVVGFFGFAFNRVIASLTNENRRILPAIASIGDYLILAAFATTLYMLYVLARHVRPEIRHRSIAAKVGIWTGSLLAHLVLVVAFAALTLVADPDFPVGPRLADSATSPDGRRVAYLYQSGIMCSYRIYLRDSGDAELRKLRDLPRDRCEQRARLRWRADSSDVEVIGDSGDVLAPQSWSFGVGPH